MINTSYVYILHFHQKHHHAQHYAGCTAALSARLDAHANSNGANLLRVINDLGLTWELGGLYSCSHAEMRRQERSLKDMKSAERYCQICHPRDQAKRPGMQIENIRNLDFPTRSPELRRQVVEIHGVHELEPDQEDAGMAFILSLMKRDKDALGFVPIGGEIGVKSLLAKRQIIIATENNEPCGYAFYTTDMKGERINIHQACVADDARLKRHGEHLVEFIAAKHIGKPIVAKVRDDLAANHFWQALGFEIALTKSHKTSGSTIHHYERNSDVSGKE